MYWKQPVTAREALELKPFFLIFEVYLLCEWVPREVPADLGQKSCCYSEMFCMCSICFKDLCTKDLQLGQPQPCIS